MKKLIVFIITSLMLCATSVYCQKSGKLEGVWKLIYQKFETPDRIMERNQNRKIEVIVASGDSLIDPDPFKNPIYKIFTKKHYSFCGLDQGNGQFVGHFGTYSYDGDTYTENIKYSSAEPLTGKPVSMKSRMDGDTWTIEGVLVIEGTEIKFRETWERVE